MSDVTEEHGPAGSGVLPFGAAGKLRLRAMTSPGTGRSRGRVRGGNLWFNVSEMGERRRRKRSEANKVGASRRSFTHLLVQNKQVKIL